MNRTKFIAFFSVFGFLFSFVIGLFNLNRVGILWIFVRALIFAVVFFILAFALYGFYEKFINTDSMDEGFDSSVPTHNLAQKIDLVTPDEPLPVDNNASQFYVGNRHQMLNREDYFASSQSNGSESSFENQEENPLSGFESHSEKSSNEENQENENLQPQENVVQNIQEVISRQNAEAVSKGSESVLHAPKEGFVPVSLQENAKNISSVEAASKSDYINEGNKQGESTDSEIDSLPDLEELQSITGTVSDENDDSGTSDFSSSKSSSRAEITEGQDTALIAKAISTVLARDS